MGGGERDDIHPPRRDGSRGERHRRSGEPSREALQGHGDPARRPAAEEHRGHRGAAGEGNRQVREAGRPDRLAGAHDEPGAHAAGRRPLRRQVSGCGDLLAASPEQEHDPRDGRDHAPRAGSRRSARRPHPVPGAAEHSGRPVPDEPGRHGPGNRGARHGEGRVQLRHARLRRRRRQLDDGDRRNRRRGPGREEHPHQQDVRLRVGVLCRRQPDRRVDRLRGAARLPRRRGRPPRYPGGSGEASGHLLGCRRASDRRHHRRLGADVGREGRIPDRPGSTVLRHRADRDRRAQPVQLGEARGRALDVPLLGLR